MKVLLDSSVLTAALIHSHPRHSDAIPWLQRAKTGALEFYCATHSLAELYATLTAMPLRPRISPLTARRLVRENVETAARLVPLSEADYSTVLTKMESLQLAGGVIYDGLIAQAAVISQVDQLVTLNGKDFRRVWPEGINRIIEP